MFSRTVEIESGRFALTPNNSTDCCLPVHAFGAFAINKIFSLPIRTSHDRVSLRKLLIVQRASAVWHCAAAKHVALQLN
jgi:hypothetical protein